MTSSAAPPSGASHPDARRLRILDTMLDMLRESSAHQLQMKDVAQRSHVALATLYRHFPAKNQLLAAALARWNEEMSGRFRAKTSQTVGDDTPQERALALYRGQLLAYRSRAHYARLEVELHTMIDPEIIASLDTRAAANRAVLRQTVPELSDEQARIASLVIGSTLFNAMALWTTGRLSFAQALRNVEEAVRLSVAPQ